MPTSTQILLHRRRNLRKILTTPERKLWEILRNKQLSIRFRRQHPVDPYILDFYCPSYHLAIEIDGDTHGEEKQQIYDTKRTEFLKSKGITLIRFTNQDIMKNIEGVYSVIQNALSSSPQPPP
jgi:very-short-patch-repair endonuclease